MSVDVTIRYPRPGLRVEEWTSPLGNYKQIKVIHENKKHKTKEEWAENLGIDLSVFQRKSNNETPEEKAERIAKATAENEKILEEWGYVRTPEREAELDAALERMGLPSTDDKAVSG